MAEHRHSSGAFRIELPDGWAADESVDNCALVAADPVEDLGFHPNLVVTVEELPGDADLASLFPRQLQALQEGMVATRVIDVAAAEVSGFAAQRVLAHHETTGDAITLEQWFVPVGRYAWYVSASVASLAYDHLADVLHEVVASFELLESPS